jgi:hypothetical protein
VPDVLDVPGVVAAQRYDIAEVKVSDDEDLPAQLPPPTHRYMVVYELDREPEAVMAQFLERVMAGRLPLGETLDLSTVSLTGWTPRGDRRSARAGYATGSGPARPRGDVPNSQLTAWPISEKSSEAPSLA